MNSNSSATVMLGLEGMTVLAVSERDGAVRETHLDRDASGDRAALVVDRRARKQACRRVGRDGHAVATVAREIGVSWATVMAVVRGHGRRLLQQARPGASATAIGVDETAFMRTSAMRPQSKGVG